MSCIVRVYMCILWQTGNFFEDGLVLSCSAFLVVGVKSLHYIYLNPFMQFPVPGLHFVGWLFTWFNLHTVPLAITKKLVVYKEKRVCLNEIKYQGPCLQCAPTWSVGPRRRAWRWRDPCACPPRYSASLPVRPPAERDPRRGIASRWGSTSDSLICTARLRSSSRSYPLSSTVWNIMIIL